MAYLPVARPKDKNCCIWMQLAIGSFRYSRSLGVPKKGELALVNYRRLEDYEIVLVLVLKDNGMSVLILASTTQVS
jgi:hypothetical protein